MNSAGAIPLSIITVPALLRVAHENASTPTELQPFGSAQENVVLDAFKIDDSAKPYLAVWARRHSG